MRGCAIFYNHISINGYDFYGKCTNMIEDFHTKISSSEAYTVELQ